MRIHGLCTLPCVQVHGAERGARHVRHAICQQPPQTFAITRGVVQPTRCESHYVTGATSCTPQRCLHSARSCTRFACSQSQFIEPRDSSHRRMTALGSFSHPGKSSDSHLVAYNIRHARTLHIFFRHKTMTRDSHCFSWGRKNQVLGPSCRIGILALDWLLIFQFVFAVFRPPAFVPTSIYSFLLQQLIFGYLNQHTNVGSPRKGSPHL